MYQVLRRLLCAPCVKKRTKGKVMKLKIIILCCMFGMLANAGAPNTVIGTVTDSGHTFNGPFGVAFTPNGTKAYVCNSNGASVSIINVVTNTVTGTVTDGGHTFNGPDDVQITPDGTKAYVCNDFSPGSVSIINVATNTVTGTVTDGGGTFNFPQAMAITPDGTKAY